MPTIVRTERLLRACKARVIVLCVLFGLYSFIPLAGAGVNDTFCELGVVAIGATAAVPGAVGDVVVALPADDVLAMTVTPNAWVLALTAANSDDAVAPLPGILVAGQGGPPPGQQPKPPPRPDPPAEPPGPPCSNPPKGCPCKNPPCGPCQNPPCGPPGSPSK